MDNKVKSKLFRILMKLFETLMAIVFGIIFLFYGYKSCTGTTKPLIADNNYLADYEVEVPYKTLLEWVTADCERMNYIFYNHDREKEEWESVDRRWRLNNSDLNYQLYKMNKHIEALRKIDSIEKTNYGSSFFSKVVALQDAIDCFNEK